MDGRAVGLIISEAMRETEERLTYLNEQAARADERSKQLYEEQKETKQALEGLKKLHRTATARIRKAERPALERARTERKPKDTILACLEGSLDMLSKEGIQQRTGLAMKTIGVVLGHAKRSGDVIEREGLYGVPQKLETELHNITK